MIPNRDQLVAGRFIARAERALRTGQPKLAMLYMRKARIILAEERAQIRRDWYAARKDTWNVMFEMVGDALRPIGAAFSAAADSLTKFVSAFNTPHQNQFGRVS